MSAQNDREICTDGLPRVLESGTHNNQKYFVVQRLGKTLSEIAQEKEGAFSLSQVISLGIQLISSLENLHNLGYTHCDLKLPNIMVGCPDNNANQ